METILESRVRRKVQARFGGGPTEKCPTRQLAGGLAYQDRDEMEVLFTLLAERYEQRSVLITTNLVFSAWDRIFKDPMTTLAAVDRVVHHSVILDMASVASFRATQAREDHTPEETRAPASSAIPTS